MLYVTKSGGGVLTQEGTNVLSVSPPPPPPPPPCTTRITTLQPMYSKGSVQIRTTTTRPLRGGLILLEVSK